MTAFRYLKQDDAWGVYDAGGYLGSVHRVEVPVWTVGQDRARGRLEVRWAFKSPEGTQSPGHWRNRDRAAYALQESVRERGAA